MSEGRLHIVTEEQRRRAHDARCRAEICASWCRGLFVDDVPLGIQVATLIPTALLGWLVWLGAYNWLASRVRSPRLIYVAVGLWLVEAAALADRLELSDGLIEMGDGNIWIDAALLLALMFVPVPALRCGPACDGARAASLTCPARRQQVRPSPRLFAAVPPGTRTRC